MGLSVNIIINKIAIIERCLKRILDTYNNNSNNLKNYDKQDIIILNLQRACEAAIDLSMHICAKKKLGFPQKSSEAFEMLAQNNIITFDLSEIMKNMVGFRNISVHDYQGLDTSILQNIIENHLVDFLEYTKMILKQVK